jgi:NSS family neurotransmitter:Na+ symporter
VEKPKRENFSSGIAVFFATLGSALGLGNMWKFPYLVGNNGGGAFLFVYLICVFLLGIPVMISEFFIGRHTRKNAIGAFTELKANPFWKCIGYMGILSSLFIMFFYTDVAGWVYSYVFRGIKGDFNILSSLESTKAANTTQSIFLNTTGAGNSAINPMIWQLIVLVVVSLIIIAGVKKGIEKVYFQSCLYL